MSASYFGKPVRYGVSVVGLERDQRRGSDDEVVEIDLGYILLKSGKRIGDNPEATGPGHETERRKRRLTTGRVVQVGRRAEESHPRLVHGGRSDDLRITYHKLLRPGWRLGGEAWRFISTTLFKNGQGTGNCRV